MWEWLLQNGGLAWWVKMALAIGAAWGTYRLIKYRKKVKATKVQSGMRVADRIKRVPEGEEDLVPQ
jgi:hypothetical protein